MTQTGKDFDDIRSSEDTRHLDRKHDEPVPDIDPDIIRDEKAQWELDKRIERRIVAEEARRRRFECEEDD